MKRTESYIVEVIDEFAFEWLVHGNFLLSRQHLKSFQFDEVAEGGRFIAYEEINDHHFVPIKGQFLAYHEPKHFQIKVFFPGGEQVVDYHLHGDDRITHIQVEWSNKYNTFFANIWRKLFHKKQDAIFQQLMQDEKQKLQEAFHLNRLNTRISGLKIDKYEMDSKWKMHSPNNPYYRWVRPEV